MRPVQSRSYFPILAMSVLFAFGPKNVVALQQRIMVADYGFSDDDAARLIRTAPAGTLILTGCRINAEPNPPFEPAFHARAASYKQAGFTVLGYVTSFDGQGGWDTRVDPPMCRDVSCINSYVDQYWTMYSDVVDGIMFDEGGGLAACPPTQCCPGRERFYQQIYDYARTRFGTVFLNVAEPLQECQQHLIDINRVADIFQLYEVPCSQYLSSYENPHWPTWWANVPPERKAELPSLCTTQQMVQAAVAQSKLYGIGWFYAYHGSADPPPCSVPCGYSQLPPPNLWDVEYPMILDSSAPRSVAELRQRFCCGDNLFENIVWTVTRLGASVAVPNSGYLRLAPDPCTPPCGGEQARVTSRLSWNLINASVSVQLRRVVNNGNLNNKFTILSGTGDYSNSLHWWYENQSLVAKYYVGGVENVVGSISPYDPMINDAWLRIQESAGVLYWETSPTGQESSWVVRGSAQTATVFPLNSIYVVLDAQTFGNGSPDPGEARYSNLNVPP